MALLHEDLIEVMPAVEEANSISEELDKRVKFEIILIAPNKLGSLKGKADGFDKKHLKSSQPEVCVKMKNLENGTEFIWPKEKFLNRLYLMKEMYNNYEEEDDDWDLPEEKDPFQEDLNQEICIGTAQVFLQPIGKSKFQNSVRTQWPSILSKVKSLSRFYVHTCTLYVPSSQTSCIFS